MRRIRFLLPAAVLAAAVACSTDDVLSVDPTTVVPADVAITDAVSARAARAGLYDALQEGSYYGESMVSYVELASDNAIHTGTFSTYATQDNMQVTAENTTINAIWVAVYQSIARANAIISKLPTATFNIDESDRDQYIGEAYLIRALGHHNATRLWGDVPIVTEVIASAGQAAEVARSPKAEVYAQILKDLDSAEAYLQVEKEPATMGNIGAARALRARVLLYMGDWAGALAAANSVIAMGYQLAPNYAELFSPFGTATPEDILRVRFTDQDAGSVSYYYMTKSLGGRREVGPSTSVRTAFTTNGDTAASSTSAGKPRRVWSLAVDSRGRNYISKFPSVVGTDNIHVIRFAEVLLIKAEAQARLGQLAAAVATLNLVRARAQVFPRIYTTQTQQQVLDWIILERRVELAFEGDRWPDMIRLGTAVTFANATCQAASGTDCPEQALWPIPSQQLDVAPNLTQNPGY